MDSELFGKLFTMQKLNILIYWLNKLQNADMGFLLSFKIKWRDIVDLKAIVQNDGNIVMSDSHNNILSDLAYAQMKISKAEHIYLLSERGYTEMYICGVPKGSHIERKGNYKYRSIVLSIILNIGGLFL